MTNGQYKWIATTAVGLILVLLGGVIQRVWSDRKLVAEMESLENQVHALTITLSGDNGYGSRVADHENRLRHLERICP